MTCYNYYFSDHSRRFELLLEIFRNITTNLSNDDIGKCVCAKISMLACACILIIIHRNWVCSCANSQLVFTDLINLYFS